MTRGTLNLLGRPRAMTADGREAALPPLSYVLAAFLLLEKPLGMATRNDIAAFLWRDAIQTRASLNLHRLIFQIIEAQSLVDVDYFIIGSDTLSLNYSSIKIDICERAFMIDLINKSRSISYTYDVANRDDSKILLEVVMSDIYLINWIKKINRTYMITFFSLHVLVYQHNDLIISKHDANSVCENPIDHSTERREVKSKLRILCSSWTGHDDERYSFASRLRHVLNQLDEDAVSNLSAEIRRVASKAVHQRLEGKFTDDDAASPTRQFLPRLSSDRFTSLEDNLNPIEPARNFSSIVIPAELSETYAHFILSECARRISNRLSSHDFALVTTMDPEEANDQRSVTVYRHIPSAKIFYVKLNVEIILDQITLHMDIFSDFGKQLTRVVTNSVTTNSTSVIDAVTDAVVGDVRTLDGGAWNAPKADEACARLVRFGRRMLNTIDATSLRRALACFESALRIAPDAPEALAGAARACVLEWFTQLNPASDRLDRAEHHARRIIELHPEIHIGYQELGYVQLYCRRFDSSVGNIRRGLQLNPGNRACISDLAATLLYTGRPAEAIEILRPGFETPSAGDEIDHWTAAGANYTLENYKESIRHLAAIREPRIGTRLVASSHAMLKERELATFHANFGKACNPGFQLGDWLPMLPIADSAQLRHYEEGLRSAGFT